MEHLRGDRRADGGLSALAGRSWDAVVDVAGYLPSEVRASTAALKGKVKLYAFVSSISAYGDTTEERTAAYEAAGQAPPSLQVRTQSYSARISGCAGLSSERIISVRWFSGGAHHGWCPG